MAWTHGTGSYDKKLSDYLRLSPPAPSTSVPSKLLSFFLPSITTTTQTVKTLAYSQVAAKTIPMYYIWVKSPAGTKYIIEWPFARNFRDQFYAGWRPNFAGATDDATRLKLIKMAQAAANTPAPSLATLATWKEISVKQDIGDLVDKRARDAAKAGATSAVVPLLVIALVGVLLLRE